jgi:two-component system CheB/CheR fusion protein
LHPDGVQRHLVVERETHAPELAREHRRPVDAFFASLAEDQGEHAACIILSGGGSDATEGVRAVKEHGGLTLAQAEFDQQAKSGMPSSAAATGLVDFVLPVEEMPARLMSYWSHLSGIEGRKGPDGARQETPSPRSSRLRRRRCGQAALLGRHARLWKDD